MSLGGLGAVISASSDIAQLPNVSFHPLLGVPTGAGPVLICSTFLSGSYDLWNTCQI